MLVSSISAVPWRSAGLGELIRVLDRAGEMT
jgi:hypothetical protein